MSQSSNITFNVADEVTKLGIECAAFVITGLDNTQYADGWNELWAKTLNDLGNSSGESELFDGFRDLHTAVGAPNRKNLSSPEALIKAVAKGRPLPAINPVVDAYNLASLTTHAAMGAHDISKINGGITLRLARGDERFVPLGSTEPVAIPSGEYVYVDDANSVICRLDVRQGADTPVTAETKDCLFIVQGHSGFPAGAVGEIAENLMADAVRMFGGEAHHLYPVQG